MAVTDVQLARWRGEAMRLQSRLVSIGQIAERLGEKTATVHSWASGSRRSSFPEPVLVAGKPTGRTKSRGQAFWLWPEVEEWYNRHGGSK